MTVGDGVMKLENQRTPPRLQAINYPQLPQGPSAVQRSAHQPRDELAELRKAAGNSCTHRTDVALQVRRPRIDPHRMEQAERHADQALAQGHELGDARGERRAHPFHVQLGRDRGRVSRTSNLSVCEGCAGRSS